MKTMNEMDRGESKDDGWRDWVALLAAMPVEGSSSMSVDAWFFWDVTKDDAIASGFREALRKYPGRALKLIDVGKIDPGPANIQRMSEAYALRDNKEGVSSHDALFNALKDKSGNLENYGEWKQAGVAWRLRSPNYAIELFPSQRPELGKWIAFVEYFEDKFTVSDGDIWPRYYYDLEVAKDQGFKWMVKRGELNGD